MKECLVIALMLSMTGMVVGQQSGSHTTFDTSRTDSTRVTRPTPPLATTRAPQSDSVERIMKLDINDNMIDAIKAGQTLEAAIDLQDATNGIVMMFDDPTTLKPRVDEIPRNLKPDFVSGNGVLHFTLDEVGLERLKTEGLQYEYRPGEKGTYKQVALKFVPSSGARTPISTSPVEPFPRNNPVSPAQDNSFGSNRQQTFDRVNSTSTPHTNQGPLNREDFGNSVVRTDRDRSFTSATTEADRYFEQQRLRDRQNEIDRQREIAGQHQVDTTRTFGIDQSRRNTKQDWNLPNTRDTRTNRHTHTFELTDQEIDALATSTNQIRSERDRREADLEHMRFEKLAADRRAQQAETDRLRLLDELRGRSPFDQTSVAQRRTLNDGLYTSYGQRSLFPAQRELSRTSVYDPLLGSGLNSRYPNRIAATDSTQLQLQQAALENERLRLQLARSETNRENTRIADARGNSFNDANFDNMSQRSPLRMTDFGASIPGSQPQGNRQHRGNNQTTHVTPVSGNLVTVTSVDNILREYNGNNFEQVASRVKGEVAAISASKNRTEKFNGFLLFLFIAFFALSLYLGWLAQSFYGQYGELADELRETFTATT